MWHGSCEGDARETAERCANRRSASFYQGVSSTTFDFIPPTLVSRRAVVVVRVLMLVLMSMVLLSSLAFSGPRRARLSTELEVLLRANGTGEARVIVAADPDAARALAARHGLRLTKLMRSGAVLAGTVPQIESLSQDAGIDTLATDQPVSGMMATTTEALGANQVWAGLDGLAGRTGAGVGVAVIDSGITEHRDLRGRIVVSVDFVNRSARGIDLYGHGTHMAGIVAGGRAGPKAASGEWRLGRT